MATKIKLTRLGKMRNPYYRIIVADARTKRDGRSIEEIGRYDPKADPSIIEVDTDRAQYWLGVGAQPTEAVAALFRVTGDWQKFKGEPAPPPMKMAAPKADKHAAFAAAGAAAAGLDQDGGAATTPKKKAATKPKADEAAPAESVVEAAPAESVVEAAPAESVVEAPAAEAVAAAVVEAPAAEAPEAAAPEAPEAVAAEAAEATDESAS